MGFVFGKKSKENVDTCHKDLQKILYLALERSQVDFTVTEGERSIELQYEYYKQNKSKIDGYKKKGKHNYNPSLAADFCAYVPGKRRLAYDVKYLCYLAGVFVACGKELYEAGEISNLIRWGGNWDGDGQIITDQNFQDLCHIELINP